MSAGASLAGAVLAGALAPASLAAQESLPALSFLDIEAGAPVEAVRARIRAADGSFNCDTSRNDPRVTDCRGSFTADDGAGVEVWLSAIDGTCGIITLSTPLDNDLLQSWRSELVQRYGQVGARAQGPQWTEEWVRRGQMLRIVWRIDGGQKRISVSLVDGRTLDGWRPTAAARPAAPSRRGARASSPPRDSAQSLEPPLSRP